MQPILVALLYELSLVSDKSCQFDLYITSFTHLACSPTDYWLHWNMISLKMSSLNGIVTTSLN